MFPSSKSPRNAMSYLNVQTRNVEVTLGFAIFYEQVLMAQDYARFRHISSCKRMKVRYLDDYQKKYLRMNAECRRDGERGAEKTDRIEGLSSLRIFES
jgi:hypothetical protein